jgi:hypothetical protein
MQSLTTDVPAYPPAVLLAYTAVFQHSFFKKLTAKTREVLGEIVIRMKHYDATEPVWFKRENVASKLSCDRKTLYHALNTLEGMGLIVREEQDITAEGFYQCTRIAGTSQLAELLGLPYPGSTSFSKTYPQAPDSASLIRGEKLESNNGGVNNVVNKQPGGNASQTTPKPRPPKQSLWSDPALVLLRSSGISAPGVFALMKLCKQNGKQRLSTIVGCLRNQIERLRGSDLFAYLRACIQSQTDFAVRHAEEAAGREADAKKERRRKFIATYAGRRFAARNGNVVEIFDGACSVCRADGAHLGSSPLQSVFDAFEAGLLTPC